MAEAAPETDHPAPDADVAHSAAKKLVSGAIGAAKASALADEDLAASLRICTLDGVAAQDADALLSKLAALSVSAALYVTVDGEETRIDSEEALFAALRAAASASASTSRSSSIRWTISSGRSACCTRRIDCGKALSSRRWTMAPFLTPCASITHRRCNIIQSSRVCIQSKRAKAP